MKLEKVFILFLVLFLGVFSVTAQDKGNVKTGILLVHYGTGNDQSRELTIDKLNSLVAEHFPDCKVIEAYSAPSVIKMLAKRGIHKLSVSEGIDSLKALGCSRLVVQTTMLLDGVMVDEMKKEVEKYKGCFSEISVGRPLLYSVEDCREMVRMIEKNLLADKDVNIKKSQVVLVGHGSDSPANAVYSQIDYLLKDEGKPMWHVGTIEGYPTMDCVMRRMEHRKVKNVLLVPLLYIAGNHQKEDIDGVIKSSLQANGYTVRVFSKGLGEMDEIMKMIVGRIDNQINKMR